MILDVIIINNSHFYSVDPEKMQSFLEAFNQKEEFVEASHWENLR